MFVLLISLQVFLAMAFGCGIYLASSNGSTLYRFMSFFVLTDDWSYLDGATNHTLLIQVYVIA